MIARGGDLRENEDGKATPLDSGNSERKSYWFYLAVNGREDR